MGNLQQTSIKYLISMWLLIMLMAQQGEAFIKSDFSIPQLCDNIKCPQLSEITCPEDSDIRELIPEPLIAEDELMSKLPVANEDDELFAHCCLTQKCQCKTCFIPDCHSDNEVVIEIQPESMDTPGQCCGLYECRKQPNCTEVHNTDNYWLKDCQRCKCIGSQSICHQSCDEAMKKPSAICHSKNLNRFFEHGKTWKDGCLECECVNGEPNCLINFCRGVNCPPHRQIMLKDSCCPVCWPKGFAMPNAVEEYDDDDGESGHHYDDNSDHDYIEQEDNIEPNIELNPISELEGPIFTNSTILDTTTIAPPSSTEATSSTSAAISITDALEKWLNASVEMPNSTVSSSEPCNIATESSAGSSTTAVPCQRQDSPATYQVYPQVVELMRYNQHNDLLYTIIGCLSVVVVILAAWNIHLKAKQRSYRPVSNLDDNFNAMASNIKKMNDYV